MDCKKSLALVMLVLFAVNTKAAPWVEPGDTRLRHHITLLADAGIITVPINTWPLMWAGVINDVKRGARRSDLSQVERRSMSYVHKAFTEQTKQRTKALSFSAAIRPNQLRSFNDTPREQNELSASYEAMGGSTSYKIKATYASDVADGDNVRLDGSYGSLLIGNWAVGAGALERWWGPSRENALALSSNARPVPGVFLQRNNSYEFDHPLLSWLGPWTLVMFAGQLESDRFVENAKLIGARVAFKPLDWLEIGASRTAQWGGKGRPQDFSSLFDAITGQDNTGTNGINRENEPSNQLAGIDWRASFEKGENNYEFYGEVIGDDESGLAPSRLIATFGLGAETTIRNSDARFYLEFTDTQSRRFYKEGFPNYAYEHGTYKSGYRYNERNIAASIDGDAKSLSLGVEIYPNADAALQVVLSKLDFDAKTGGVGNTPLAQTDGSGWQAKLKYIESWNEWDFGYGFYFQAGDYELREMGNDSAGVEFSASREF